jgi:catabolite regulation protein CreA
VWSRRAGLSAHTHMHKIEDGADAGSRGITCYMVRPTRASYIGISQQWRASNTHGNSVTPAQVTPIKVKDESIDLIVFASIEVSVEIVPSTSSVHRILAWRSLPAELQEGP